MGHQLKTENRHRLPSLKKITSFRNETAVWNKVTPAAALLLSDQAAVTTSLTCFTALTLTLCQSVIFFTQTWDSGKSDDSAPPHLSQQQKKEHGDVSRPLNFPEFGASVHSAMKAFRSVMWIGSWVWCCELKRVYI